MYVYMITNKINHKKYIGITQRTIEERWEEHIHMAYCLNHKDSKSLFKKAIRKYGKDAWIVEELDTASSIEELKEKEIYWIAKLKTYAFDEDGWGYNSTKGGDYVTEQIQRAVYICDIISGTIIKECKSLREAEKITGVKIEFIEKENATSGGYCILDREPNQFLSKEQLKEKIHSLYPHLVYQLDLKGNILNLYRNTTEAANAISCPQGNLINVCLGNRRLCYGYQWVYQKDIKDRVGKPPREINKATIPVIQYSLGGYKIREWKSIKEAVRNGKGSDSHISQCCAGKREQCGGFQWRYAEDEIEQLPPIFTKRKVQCIETKEIFDTPNHAAKKFGYAQQTIKSSCINEGKSTKEFHFIWYDDLDEE